MKKTDKSFVIQGNRMEEVSRSQKLRQWFYGVIEPYIIRYSDFMLRTPMRKEIFVKMSKPRALPSGVIISTDAACRFVDYIYAQNSEDDKARMAVTKCVCQTALKRPREPEWKDMALLYAADMYTTFLHTGIKEKFYRIETAEEAKENLRYFNARGLMHNVLYCHQSSKWTFVLCNCDNEVCVPFRSYMAGRKNEMSAGPEIVQLNREKCVGTEKCGLCIERCNLQASFIGEDGRSSVRYDGCLGCGLCVTTCKHQARAMVRRSDYEHEDVLTTDILLGNVRA